MRLPLVCCLVAGVVAVLLAASSSAATTPRARLAVTPRTALTGELVRASLRGSSVPSGTTLRRVTISWGDGSPPAVLHSLAASPAHHFHYAGHFTVKATVTDSKGVSTTASLGERVVVQNVYWDLFWGQSLDYQLQYTKLPLTAKSTDTSVSGSGDNGLRCTSGMAAHHGKLFVISYPSGCSAPSPAEIQVFQLPFTGSSNPIFTLTLPGTGDVDGLTFDGRGDLWVEDAYNKTVSEFQGPFTDNTTLVSILTLPLPAMSPSGLVFDPKGDLFVANVSSTSTRSIAMYRAPITEASTPKFLKGLVYPGGLTVDGNGDLYASTNPLNGKGAAIVRYDAGDLKAGAKPSVVDKAGLTGIPYEANFAWDASGNLYVADCGSVANVRIYPLATRAFTSKLAASVTHRDPAFDQVECAWGLAVG